MLNVRVMVWVVGDQVMHIVIVAPPAQRQPANQISNDGPNQAIEGVIVRDARMASIVGCECELVPEEAQEEGRCEEEGGSAVGVMPEEVRGEGQSEVARAFTHVAGRSERIEARGFDLFV